MIGDDEAEDGDVNAPADDDLEVRCGSTDNTDDDDNKMVTTFPFALVLSGHTMCVRQKILNVYCLSILLINNKEKNRL